MAASGIFIGLSESDILAIRDKAVAMLKEGKTILSYSPGDGSSVSKQFVMPVKEVLAECRMALQQLDPDTYGKRLTVIRPEWGTFDGF
jgi:hypothetical protein